MRLNAIIAICRLHTTTRKRVEYFVRCWHLNENKRLSSTSTPVLDGTPDPENLA